MFFSKYSERLGHSQTIHHASRLRLDQVLRERSIMAPCVDMIRFGFEERRLLDEIRKAPELSLPTSKDPLVRAKALDLDGSVGIDKSPREVYESEVMPRAQKECEKLAEARDVAPIGPLNPTYAREVAFSILDDLQAECSLAALGARPGVVEREDVLDGATQTAVLATQLFGEPVDRSMIDDWGRGQRNGPANARISIPHRLAEFLRNSSVYHSAAHDLRLLLGEADEEMGELAVDVWGAHTVLLHNHRSYASPLSPSWWIRPTPYLPGYLDRLNVCPDVVLEPFEVPGVTRRAVDDEVELLSLSPASARGLAAVCGMLLVRLTLADNPSYARKESQELKEPISPIEIAKLHRRLLGCAGLL